MRKSAYKLKMKNKNNNLNVDLLELHKKYSQYNLIKKCFLNCESCHLGLRSQRGYFLCPLFVLEQRRKRPFKNITSHNVQFCWTVSDVKWFQYYSVSTEKSSTKAI